MQVHVTLVHILQTMQFFKNNLSSFVVFLRNFFMPSFTSTFVVAHCTACQADIGQITLRKFQLITVTGVPKQSINC